MSLATQQLPEDLEALRAFAASLQTELARKELEIAANAAEIHAKTLHIEKLKMQLAALRRARFGRSSEQLDHEIEQLELLIGELEENVAADEARARTPDPATGGHPAQPVHPRPRRQPVRTPLPSPPCCSDRRLGRLRVG
jgi:transposase